MRSFNYLGREFKPYRNFKKAECSAVKDKPIFEVGCLGNKIELPNFKYKEFYQVAKSRVDIFLMDGRQVVATSFDSLYYWNENFLEK